MSGIGGFFHPAKDYMEQREYFEGLLDRFRRTLKHRGPDDSGTFLSSHCGLARTWLAVSDTKNGHEPVQLDRDGRRMTLVHDGEIYNKKELARQLAKDGASWLSFDPFPSEGQILLAGFFQYGPEFISQVNGVFAIALYDEKEKCLYLFRDRCGAKPLFYCEKDGGLFFSSEIKGLFAMPGITPSLDRNGLNEVFSLGPARTPGNGVFCGIKEVLPAHFLTVCKDGAADHCYWTLKSRPHEDDLKTTVEKTAFLIQDAVIRQIEADVPICSFLSGGIDSSIVSSICARELKKRGKRLTTYSFDFKDNDKNFRSNAFQPSLDRPYVEKMAAYLDSDHHFLECTSAAQADGLYGSIKAHDLPNMADIDSSLLYFCSLVGKEHSVALTGECADEIFGGYPWFHKEECLTARTFPWTMDLNARKILLKDDFIEYLDMDGYVQETWQRSAGETPLLEGETETEKNRRIISWLNLKWFMQTLLNRMDRDGSSASLAARVPFADHRIIEYLWNVPWEMKTAGGVVKGLLREASKGLLPEEVLWRRKSPYPKTYDKGYEALLASRLRQIMDDPSSPILEFLDKKKVEMFLESPSDYGRPWYGQLMAAPQMIAYMIQLDFWLRNYL